MQEHSLKIDQFAPATYNGTILYGRIDSRHACMIGVGVLSVSIRRTGCCINPSILASPRVLNHILREVQFVTALCVWLAEIGLVMVARPRH